MASYHFHFLDMNIDINLSSTKIGDDGKTMFDKAGRPVHRSRRDAINEVLAMVGPGHKFKVTEA